MSYSLISISSFNLGLEFSLSSFFAISIQLSYLIGYFSSASISNISALVIVEIISATISVLPFSKFTIHFCKASKSGFSKFSRLTQALYLIELIVETKTTASGFRSPILHFISKNFSAQRSDPNQASVITKSLTFSAVFVAIKLLHQCAMFAKGQP